MNFLKQDIEKRVTTGKAVVASFGGAALGDVAFVPGMGLKDPKRYTQRCGMVHVNDDASGLYSSGFRKAN